MDDRQLRSNLIRLAHQHPELREKLLPVLKQAAGSPSDRAVQDLKSILGHLRQAENEVTRMLARLYNNPSGQGFHLVSQVRDAIGNAQSVTTHVAMDINSGNFSGGF